MAQTIESKKLFVKDVFLRWYRIPEYQRPYVWESDQVIELLDDVYRACESNPDSQYFLGSMVLQKNEKKEGATKYEEYDLLDGQQRLTTLFLIHAVVRDTTISTTRQKTCCDTIFQMENSDDNIPERSRIVFDIRDKVRDFVDSYIKTDKGTSKKEELTKLSQDLEEDISIRNMSNAILTIQAFFNNENIVNKFFPFLRSNVLMIYVAAEDLEDAFHLFTVMNNRGIRLRNSDILKAENLAKILDDNTRIKYAKKWEDMEGYFAEDFDAFLSHLRMILVKQKAGYNLLKEYEENIYAPTEFDRNTKKDIAKKPLLIKGKPTIDFIESYYEHYKTLFDEDNENLTNSFELFNQLVLMKFGLEADFWVAPLLRYYEKFKTAGLIKFLNLLDKKFSADWIVGLTPTKRIENANIIIKKIDELPNPQLLFESQVFDFNKDDLKKIISGSIYGRRFARYLLLKLELAYHGHTTKFTPPATISIEHILPQTPKPSSQWVSDFTESDREKWTNRLGNLILLSRKKNSAQSNLDYCDKREKYFKKNVELFSNSVRIFKIYATWSLQDLVENHKETLQKTLELYGISLTEAEISDLEIK